MDDRRYLIIHAFLSGNLDRDAAEELTAWVGASEDNRKVFEQVKTSWEAAEHFAAPGFDADKGFERFEASLKRPDSRPLAMYIMRAAAVALILVSAGWYYLTQVRVDWDTFQGAQQEFVLLEDGTEVHLSGDAVMEAPDEFSAKKREVVLTSGRAFFDVASNPEIPFEIDAGDLDIRVLGTSFEVLMDVPDEAVRVCVTEGKVRLTPEGTSQHLDLMAGECGSLRNFQDHLELKKIREPDFNQLAWHTGELYFKDQPVSDILEAVEETFDVTVQSKECDVLDCEMTIPFKSLDATAILNAVADVFNAKLEKGKNGSFTLSGGNSDCLGK